MITRRSLLPLPWRAALAAVIAASASCAGTDGGPPGSSGDGASGAGGHVPGAGGAAGSSPAGAGGANADGCQGDETRFALDDRQEQIFNRSQWSENERPTDPDAWSFIVSFAFGVTDTYRFGVFSGAGNSVMRFGRPAQVLEENVAIPIADSVWALDATDTVLGEVLCTRPGSGSTITRRGEQVSLALQEVTSLGSCPGATPVDGELQVCSQCFSNTLTGSLEGMPWMVSYHSTESGIFNLVTADGSVLRFANAGTTSTWGLLLTTPSSPGGGAAFCIGSAVFSEDDMIWKFGDFSKLGPCAAGGSSTLAVCGRPAAP